MWAVPWDAGAVIGCMVPCNQVGPERDLTHGSLRWEERLQTTGCCLWRVPFLGQMGWRHSWLSEAMRVRRQPGPSKSTELGLRWIHPGQMGVQVFEHKHQLPRKERRRDEAEPHLVSEQNSRDFISTGSKTMSQECSIQRPSQQVRTRP